MNEMMEAMSREKRGVARGIEAFVARRSGKNAWKKVVVEKSRWRTRCVV